MPKKADTIILSGGEAEAEADYISEPDELTNKLHLVPNLFRRYCHLPCDDFIGRTYEGPTQWFFLTFKPYNHNYDMCFNGLDHVRKTLTKYGGIHYVITREIYAAKVHYNAICVSDKEMSVELDGHNTNRYKVWCNELKTLADRQRVYDYITKELKQRNFKKYVDYVYKM